jgi:hypothetical protein
VIQDNIWIYDIECFAHDWIVVFKNVMTGDYEVMHNNPYQVQWFMEQDPLLCGFNNKHYDNHLLKAILAEGCPEDVKDINDLIILEHINGWDIPELARLKIYFDSFDLMDDMQEGLSLKSIEAHLNMSIEETEVDFNLDRELTPEEIEQTIKYCKYDVDSTEKLFHLRENYLQNKIKLGEAVGIDVRRSLYMTNAKLTSAYLHAVKPLQPYTDERDYKYPENLLKEYIPDEVFEFFDKLHNPEVKDYELFGGYDEHSKKYEGAKLELMVGECETTIAYGGIHGAIPTYTEESTETRSIRNKDVASYYPNIVRVMGYNSRNIPNPDLYAQTIAKRVEAKKSGDKATANALKLVLNTTYGAMLHAYNDLYDPLMGRSVCITGQLFLLELSEHLIKECPTLKVIQLNTDGIMVSFDNTDEEKWQEITQEWQDRTGFELEEDFIRKVVQKDVNNYIEVPVDETKEIKVKGGQLVRGVDDKGAWKVNNNATIVAKAIQDYFVSGTIPEETINASDNIFEFQLIAKASSKYSRVYQSTNTACEIPVQRCNRVYASKDKTLGTLYKVKKENDSHAKIAGLPTHCVIDNDNHLTLDAVDRKWYIRLAWKYIKDFQGIKPEKKNTRKINKLAKDILAILGD